MDSLAGSPSSSKKRKRDRAGDLSGTVEGEQHRSSTKKEKRSKKSSKKDRQSTSKPATAPLSQRMSSEDGVELSLGLEPAIKKSEVVETGLDVVFPTVRVPIPPVWVKHPVGAVAEMFDAMIMRYIPALSGVLLTHSDHLFLSPTARIDADSAFAVVPVGLRCLVWAPTVGMRLRGTILHSTPSHISLLVHGIFNATITAPHLPATPGALGRRSETGARLSSNKAGDSSGLGKDDEWEFVYDEGVRSDASEEQQEQEQDEGQSPADDDEIAALGLPKTHWRDKNLGYWRRKWDHERLGGYDGHLEFTVISMVIANSMLTLNGSILSSPFSVPPPQAFNETSTSAPAQIIPDVFGSNTASSVRRVRWADDEEDEEAEEDFEDDYDERLNMEPPAPYPDEVAPIGPTLAPPNGKGHKRKLDDNSDDEDEDAARSRRKREKKEARKKEKRESGSKRTADDLTKEEKKRRKEEKKRRKEA